LRKEFADLVEELVQYKKEASQKDGNHKLQATFGAEVAASADFIPEQPKQAKPFAIPKLNLNKK
jgi:hypothetical protein